MEVGISLIDASSTLVLKSHKGKLTEVLDIYGRHRLHMVICGSPRGHCVRLLTRHAALDALVRQGCQKQTLGCKQ